jgi:hypothetical protein
MPARSSTGRRLDGLRRRDSRHQLRLRDEPDGRLVDFLESIDDDRQDFLADTRHPKPAIGADPQCWPREFDRSQQRKVKPQRAHAHRKRSVPDPGAIHRARRTRTSASSWPICSWSNSGRWRLFQPRAGQVGDSAARFKHCLALPRSQEQPRSVHPHVTRKMTRRSGHRESSDQARYPK